jgi:hypothetical protein
MIRLFRGAALLTLVAGMLWLGGRAPAEVPAAGAAHDPNCPAPCVAGCPRCAPQCVLVPGKKVISKPIYKCKIVEFCTKGICFGYEHGCCQKFNDNGRCNHHVRKVLMKKMCTQECPTMLCEPASKHGPAPESGPPATPGIDLPF